MKLQSNFLGKLNLSNKIAAVNDFTCYHNFSAGFGGCESRFIRELTVIWGGFVMGMESSLAFAVQLALGVALIASTAVYIEREVCFADVFTSFNICAQAYM